MRLISFQHRGRTGVGVMASDTTVIDLAKAAPSLPAEMRALLRIGESWRERVEEAVLGKAADLSVEEISFEPVIIEPQATWCVALNYQAHKDETGLERSAYPEFFLRVPTSVVGHLHELLPPKPQYMNRFDFEGELAVIIGKPGRYIDEKEALSHVAGYSCYNEGSVRNFQEHNRQFGLGKNFEASGSFGPWLMTADEFGRPEDHTVSTRLNGVTRQHAPISDLLFSVEKIIHYLSTGYSLRPGDVIITGTPGALPPQPGDTESVPEKQYGRFKVPGLAHMRAGGTVEVEISGLGVLRNPIVADAPVAYRPGT